MKRGLFFAALVAFALVVSCSGPVPPIPTPKVDGFDPEVRDAILTAYEQAVAAPESGQATGRLGMVLHAHAVYPTADAAYQRAIRLDPNEFAWRYYYALVVWQLSGPEKALAALSAALHLRPNDVPANLRKADALFQLGRFKESSEVYKKVLAVDPASANALYGIARVKYEQGDTAAAEDFYSRAGRAYPTFGAAYYGLGLTQRNSGQNAEAEKNIELAQRYGNDHPPDGDPLSRQLAALATGVYYHLAESDRLAHSGHMDDAARLNEAMLDRDPESFTVLLNLLFLARFVDRLDDKAASFYSRARQIDAQVPLIYDYYGVALARQGKYDAAMAELNQAIELRPDYAEAHAVLADVLDRQSRPTEAIDHYRRALAAQPSDRAFQMKLWRLLIVHGRSRDALPELISSLQLDDSYAALRRVLLGEAYLTLGDADRARQYLEQARNRARSEGPPELAAQIDQELEQLARRR
jgi:tetratricopeptide (TPR) repeat protein